MASPEGRSLGAVVGENLRLVRGRRGMSVRALSERLGELGHPLIATGITKSERDTRPVSLDDLTALALALGTSPWFLLSPRTDEWVDLTPRVRHRGQDVSRWLRGDAMLAAGPEGDEAAAHAEALAATGEDAPPWVRHEHGTRPDPAALVLSRLNRLVAEALDGDQRRADLDALAGELRRQAESVARQVGLLADEVEARARRQGEAVDRGEHQP